MFLIANKYLSLSDTFILFMFTDIKPIAFFDMSNFFLLTLILLNFSVFLFIFILCNEQKIIYFQQRFCFIIIFFDILFDILLASVSFLRTYYDTYSFPILFCFFLLQISFCDYFSPLPLICLCYFYSNLFFNLVSNLLQCSRSFLYIPKNL